MTSHARTTTSPASRFPVAGPASTPVSRPAAAPFSKAGPPSGRTRPTTGHGERRTAPADA
jgi:hypothetical protein